MDLKTFFENFETIAEAPGGIDKLRSLILDLTILGKLTRQNSIDEPPEHIVNRPTNGTEDGIADELIQAGIPKSEIVLGFQEPAVRPCTGFAIAQKTDLANAREKSSALASAAIAHLDVQTAKRLSILVVI